MFGLLFIFSFIGLHVAAAVVLGRAEVGSVRRWWTESTEQWEARTGRKVG